jgi:hypothetical protein
LFHSEREREQFRKSSLGSCRATTTVSSRRLLYSSTEVDISNGDFAADPFGEQGHDVSVPVILLFQVESLSSPFVDRLGSFFSRSHQSVRSSNRGNPGYTDLFNTSQRW